MTIFEESGITYEEKDGLFYPNISTVNEEAYEMLENIENKYLEKHKPVNPSSTMEIWKLREQARMVAEEEVLADIVYHYY